MAFPSTILALAHASSSNFLSAWFGGSVAHSVGDNMIIDDLAAVETKLGIGATTPDAIHKSLKATGAGVTSWGYHTPVKLAEVSGTGSSGVLEFASIPATFRTLVIHLLARSTGAGTADTLRMTFEAVGTAGAYSHQFLRGNAGAASSVDSISTNAYMQAGSTPAVGSTAFLHSFVEIVIPEYANVTTLKVASSRVTGSTNLAAGGFVTDLYTGTFGSGAAINLVRLILATGNFTTSSRATLYGLPA